jgi:hypothetical protein
MLSASIPMTRLMSSPPAKSAIGSSAPLAAAAAPLAVISDQPDVDRGRRQRTARRGG